MYAKSAQKLVKVASEFIYLIKIFAVTREFLGVTFFRSNQVGVAEQKVPNGSEMQTVQL